MRRVSYLLILLCCACSSGQISTEKLSDPNNSFCEGTKARKKFEFIISGYLKVPPGTLVHLSTPYLERLQGEYNFVLDNWMRDILSYVVVVSKGKVEIMRIPEARKVYIKDDASPSHAYSGSVVRTGAFSFVLCDDNMCSGLSDPINGKVIDPKKYDFATYSKAQFYSDTGFSGGNLLYYFYFPVPERDRSRICTEASVNPECFKELKYDLKLQSNKEFWEWIGNNFPFAEAYASRHSSFYDNAMAIDPYKDGFARYRFANPHVQLEWESAFSKDLFLRASTKVTKKIQGDWVISRITWDPTLFCKYGKPISDFYTH